ncbi:transglutaminase domain-containing protein [Hanstruepera ponticola]|uniref:transglutaminase domain-containing protein n=1 Tax=Hanstruepera ponticola TaxID=2042995 RepID=UPI000CF01AF9|nr:transglutaminase domain-containing protein [Hanstruepera ponticola]
MKHILTIFLLITIHFSFAQNFKFGKVSKEELSEKVHPLDSSAHAAILYKSYKVYFDFRENEGFVQVNEIVERIKIYDKDGYDYATHQVRLYDESATNKQELKGLKAYTYYLDGGKVEKDKLKNESVFEEKVNDYWSTTKFTMPSINDGVVIEYEYRIESPFYGIEDIILQYNVPINVLEVDVRTPEYFVFNKLLNPKSTFYPTIEENSISRTEIRKASVNRSSADWQFQENIVMINANNVPALKLEPFTDNINNYRAKLIMEYAYFKGPNGQSEIYATDWDQVVKRIYDSESFGGQLQKTNYFEDDLNNILQGVTDPMEKAFKVYNFVKSKVKQNDFVGYSSDQGVKQAYKSGEGNVGDINLMLVAMLRYAGLNANPILLSTRSNGIPIVATRKGFNYVIAAIEVSNGFIMLDATDVNASPNILPIHTLNWQGRIVREHGSSAWVNLLPSVSSKEVTSINAKLNADLSVDGKVRTLYSNYLAYNFRDDYKGLDEESHIALLEKDKGDIEISNLEFTNQYEVEKPITFSYDYHVESEIEEIGDKLYFSPMLFFTPKENFFKQETRSYPIDFIYPISEKYTVNIMLPEGYIVESLPESSKIEFNGNQVEFSYLARENGSMLQFSINLDINKSLILTNEYKQFKKFFEFMIEKETEKVVLKKG